MSIAASIAIYFIIWWTALFVVLPWGVRTQADDDAVVPGSAPSAPSRPLLARKLIATTIVSAVIFVIVYIVLTTDVVTLDSVPFLPRFEPI